MTRKLSINGTKIYDTSDNSAVAAADLLEDHRTMSFSQTLVGCVSILDASADSDDTDAKSLLIDDRTKMILREGEPVRLSPKEYKLLKLLAVDAGRVVSSEEIINHLWPGRSGVTLSDVKQAVYLLRKRIEQNPAKPRWIHTVKGFGYQLLLSGNCESG